MENGVCGQPAKGMYTFYARGNGLTSSDTGVGVFDAVRITIGIRTFEILGADGTPIGSVMTTGLTSGSPPPGSPLATVSSNFAIAGGTGAFLGVRGQSNDIGAAVPGGISTRTASIAEDQANRRKNGGGKGRMLFTLFPMSTPQIVSTPSGPAIVHSKDFSPVTSSKPAGAGEILSLVATGLGPTVPGVDPGQSFPASPPANVNSPVQVSVNGKAAKVIGAVGYPGAVDGYQVNFQVPADTAQGPAAVQLTVAWIPGLAVSVPVQ